MDLTLETYNAMMRGENQDIKSGLAIVKRMLLVESSTNLPLLIRLIPPAMRDIDRMNTRIYSGD